jgi:hypothetical protein
MKKFLSSWEAACAASTPLRFLLPQRHPAARGTKADGY